MISPPDCAFPLRDMGMAVPGRKGIITVIASAAKQSKPPKRKSGLLRRFRLRSLSYGGQVAPRNDVKTQIRVLAARYTRALQETPSENRGRRERRGAPCTRSLACKVKEHTSVVTTGSDGFNRLSPRNGFSDLFRALPGDRAFLSPSSADMFSADLTPASRRQDHTTSPSASAPFVNPRCRVHRIPPRVRDDRDTPLCEVGRRGYRSDLGKARSGIF